MIGEIGDGVTAKPAALRVLGCERDLAALRLRRDLAAPAD